MRNQAFQALLNNGRSLQERGLTICRSSRTLLDPSESLRISLQTQWATLQRTGPCGWRPVTGSSVLPCGTGVHRKALNKPPLAASREPTRAEPKR